MISTLTEDSKKLDTAAEKMGIKRFGAQSTDTEFIETDASLVRRMYVQFADDSKIPTQVEFWDKKDLYRNEVTCTIMRK
jgi:hypothetical protein